MEVGISIPDLDLLTIGLVLDIWTEKGNDSVEYATLATQEDFDRWYGLNMCMEGGVIPSSIFY